MPKSLPPSKITQFFLFFLIFIFSFLLFAKDIKTDKYFSQDEPWWISISSATANWIAKGDFRYETWRAKGYTADIAVTSPPFVKYLIGFSLRFSGFKEPLWYPWDWFKTEAENIALGHLPSAEILGAARVPNIIFSALLLSLVSFLAFLCTKSWVAAGFSFLSLIFHPIFQDSSRIAMLDMPAATLSLMCILSMIHLFTDQSQYLNHRIITKAILCGVVMGLAVSSKMNTLIIVINFIFLTAGLAILSLVRPACRIFSPWMKSPKNLFLCLSAALATATGLFYAMNPILWHHPIKGLQHLLFFTKVLKAWEPSLKFYALYSPLEKFIYTTNTVLFNNSFLLMCFDILMDWFFVFVGIFMCFFKLRAPSQKDIATGSIILSWFFSSFLLVALWVPYTWNRYYLPIVVPMAILEGIGLFYCLILVARVICSWFQATSQTADHWLNNSKMAFSFLTAFLLFSLAAIKIYEKYSHALIAEIYYGRSFSFLNRLIEGQARWPLEDYFKKADNLFYAGLLLTGTFGFLFFSLKPKIQHSLKAQEEIRPERALFHFARWLRDASWKYILLPLKKVFYEFKKEWCSFSGPDEKIERAAVMLLAFLPFFFSFYYVVLKQIPFWIHSDPDLWYFASGVQLIAEHKVTFVDNPGIIAHIIISFLLLPQSIVAKVLGIPIPEFFFVHSEITVLYLRIVFAFFVTGGIVFFSLAIRKLHPQKGAAIFTTILLLSVYTLFFNSIRVRAETILVFLTGLWIFIYACWIKEADKESKDRIFYLLCFVAGIAVATKYTAFVLVLACLFFLSRYSQALLFCLLGFLIGVFPLWFYPERLFGSIGWIMRVATHRGFYGEFGLGVPTLTEYLDGIKIILLSEKYFLLFFFSILIIFLVMNFFAKKRWEPIKHKVLMISSVIWLFVIFKNPGPRYATTAFLLLLFCFLDIFLRQAKTLKKPVMYFLFSAALIPAIFSLHAYSKRFTILRADCNIFNAYMKETHALIPPGKIIAYSYMEPMWEVSSIMFASNIANKVFGKAIEKHYPSIVEYVLWKSGEIEHPNGDPIPVKEARWDYLYFPVSDYFKKFEKAMDNRGFRIISEEKRNEVYFIKREAP